MTSNTIFIKTVKKADHTVFCVDSEGQKMYWDSQFKKQVPYSSGQQVKRSIINAMLEKLGVEPAPFVMLWEKTKKAGTKGKEKIEFKKGFCKTCTPAYPDQLIGGWMHLKKSETESKKVETDVENEDVSDTDDEIETETENQSNSKSVKRRSPLSISAMTPLHPLLANVTKEGISLDKRDVSNVEIVVKSGKDQMSDDDIRELLLQKPDHNFKNTFVFDNKRASGMFVQNIAIDLKRLFAISLDNISPEVAPNVIEELKSGGWIVKKDNRGEYLLAPDSYRKELIPAIAHSLINWTITSNQSRTYSPMETLVVAISDNANSVGNSIYAKLNVGKNDELVAEPVISSDVENVDIFIAPQAQGYFLNIEEKNIKANAINDAVAKLIDVLSNFEY